LWISASKDLIDHLLVVDIKSRWKAEDVLLHPWIITQGHTKELPANFSEHRKQLLSELKAKGKQYASEPMFK
jgi:serine/threonine protein kinase